MLKVDHILLKSEGVYTNCKKEPSDLYLLRRPRFLVAYSRNLERVGCTRHRVNLQMDSGSVSYPEMRRVMV